MPDPKNTMIKPVAPKNMDAVFEEIEKEVAFSFREEVLIAQRMFQRTVRTWRKRPLFVYESERRGRILKRNFAMWARTWTSNRIYYFITHGTRIRWAVMSPDFDPKTVRRMISSAVGAGGPVIVGKRAMQERGIAPRPGIEGREFDLEIQERRQKIFPAKLMAAIKRGARRGNRKARRQRS